MVDEQPILLEFGTSVYNFYSSMYFKKYYNLCIWKPGSKLYLSQDLGH